MAPKKDQQQQLLDAALGSYPDEYLSCRDMGHAWKPVTAIRRPDRNIERILGCTRCGARRTQVLDRSGYILSSNYSYAEHYTISGAGRMTTATRARLRLSNLLRLLDK